jgi:glycosyltransferase involved in cell wall biosynthesis
MLKDLEGRSVPKMLVVTTIPTTLRDFLLPFARHFRARGFRVDALAEGVSAFPECVAAYDRVWDVTWSRNPLDPRNFYTAPRRVHDVALREGYDLVHVHTPVAGFVTRYALRHLRRQGALRVIYTAHGFHFYRGGPRLRGAVIRGLEKLAGRWTDYLVVINSEDEQAARRYGLVPPERVRYMPGIGVDMQYYGPDSVSESQVVAVRRELRLAPGEVLFLVIAEMIPRKRHTDVLRAFARLGRPDTFLALAGDGPQEGPLRRLAAALGIGDRVRFLGVRRDVPALVLASAATVLASAQEGLPRSIMESLSLGVPVIGSRIRGVADLLDGGCGLLVPCGDVAGLAGAMAHLLDHPEEARAMGRRGRERMAAYELRHILKLHEALYDEALGRANPVNCDPLPGGVAS